MSSNIILLSASSFHASAPSLDTISSRLLEPSNCCSVIKMSHTVVTSLRQRWCLRHQVPNKGSTPYTMKHIKLFPEASLSVEMPNKSVPNRKFLVTGQAVWALEYRTTRDEGTLLVVMEAKQRSKGETQLIAYLAILQENCRRARKTNIITQCNPMLVSTRGQRLSMARRFREV
jgi:hypothetical protein